MAGRTGTDWRMARELSVADIPMDRPIVTLDIDGVLNAFDHGRELASWQRPVEDDPITYDIDHREDVEIPEQMCRDFGQPIGRSYWITWSSDLMADIAELAATGAVTIVWLTSWNGYADFLANTRFWPGADSPAAGFIDVTHGQRRHAYGGKVAIMDALCEAMMAAHPNDDPLPVIAFDDDQPWTAKTWDGSGMMPWFFHGIGTDPRFGITLSQWMGALDLIGEATGEADAE